MAGHSKYANIKHRKNAQDAKRAKKFNKLAKEIAVAVRTGGGDDPEFNPRLRTAISNAKSENLPKDRIKRAIDSGLGKNNDEGVVEEFKYEGYGPDGVAVIVEVMSDNRNRAASEIRNAFSKSGGSMGESGCVIYMFEHVGRIILDKSAAGDEEIFEVAVEAGAENVKSGPKRHVITTALDDFADILDQVEAKYGQPKSSGMHWRANTVVSAEGEQLEKLANFIETMDELEDVQKVYMNLDEDSLEKLDELVNE